MDGHVFLATGRSERSFSKKYVEMIGSILEEYPELLLGKSEHCGQGSTVAVHHAP